MHIDQLRQAVQPDQLRRTLTDHSTELGQAAGHHHPEGGLVDTRTATHQGHEIVVRTTYEITVDGKPFDVSLSVTNNGRVHYHGLPTRDFSSVIDLVEKAIDVFGGDFSAEDHAGHHHGAGEH